MSIAVAVIGTGGVGSAFLSQLALLQETYPQIAVVLLARSKHCLHASALAESISLRSWKADLLASTSPVPSFSKTAAFLSNLPAPAILVDNTSSQDLANAYPLFLRQGINVVTPNKKAFSGSQELWAAIRAAVRSPTATKGGLLYHEASVGAGLPIISTLNDLLATGDRITRIDGVFSGTMSFLFNSFAPVPGSAAGSTGSSLVPWSTTVKKARELGYTEPDPRDDLNGLDVARKLVILARLAGLTVAGPEAFLVQSLIPEKLQGVEMDADHFLARLGEFDAEMDGLKAAAERQGKVVRFVGSVGVETGEMKVGLESVETGSAIAGLKGSDNIISFYTRRYGERPLIVQGAGAGAEVTAMGVTADFIKVLQRLQVNA